MITSARRNRLAAHPSLPLVAVAVAYAVAQLIAVTPRMRLGWDETVYVSQVSPHVPAAFFSAPRARGITLLPAPIVALTSSLAALRVYLTALSSAGLVAAFWPWTRMLRPLTVALAALLFASLWVVEFYGNEVMPNLYVAYGAVAATGWFVLAARARNRARRPLFLLTGSLAWTALVRPSDAAWLGLPLLAAILFAHRRRLALLCAVAGGLVAGAVPWLVEAYVRFGDPLRRLRAADKIEGGLGWHPDGIAMNLHALNSTLLCRPCTGATWHVPLISLWWPLVPLFAVGGLVPAARERRLKALLVPVVCGAVMAASYLLLVGYAAPRFLIPAYALLSLAVAGLLTAPLLPRGWWRIAPMCALAACVAVFAAGQQLVLAHIVAAQRASRGDYAWLADRLHALGLRPPCAISGDQAPPLAFYAGCASVEATGNNASATVERLIAIARKARFAEVEHLGPRPAFAHGWRRYRLITPAGKIWRVYVPPRPKVTTTRPATTPTTTPATTPATTPRSR